MLPVTVQSSTNLFALPVNGSYDPAVVMLPLYSPVGPVGLSPPIPASEEPRPSSEMRRAGKNERWKFFLNTSCSRPVGICPRTRAGTVRIEGIEHQLIGLRSIDHHAIKARSAVRLEAEDDRAIRGDGYRPLDIDLPAIKQTYHHLIARSFSQ